MLKKTMKMQAGLLCLSLLHGEIKSNSNIIVLMVAGAVLVGLELKLRAHSTPHTPPGEVTQPVAPPPVAPPVEIETGKSLTVAERRAKQLAEAKKATQTLYRPLYVVDSAGKVTSSPQQEIRIISNDTMTTIEAVTPKQLSQKEMLSTTCTFNGLKPAHRSLVMASGLSRQPGTRYKIRAGKVDPSLWGNLLQKPSKNVVRSITPSDQTPIYVEKGTAICDALSAVTHAAENYFVTQEKKAHS